MKKLIAIFIVGGILGAGGGFTLGIFFYPFIFLDDIVANEQVANADTKTKVAAGEFIHANPMDPIHWGKGNVTVFDDLVHLNMDFEVGPGPKYKVLLSDRADIKKTSDVSDSKTIDLGMIKAFKGSQNYSIPAGTDLSTYKSVVIWCEAFGVLISPATLKFGS